MLAVELYMVKSRWADETKENVKKMKQKQNEYYKSSLALNTFLHTLSVESPIACFPILGIAGFILTAPWHRIARLHDCQEHVIFKVINSEKLFCQKPHSESTMESLSYLET